MELKPGDIVKIKKDNVVWEGIVMPREDKKYITLKLKNGYNIGIKVDKNTKIEKIGEIKLKKQKPVSFELEFKEELPLVSVLSTGGTIASSIDYETGAIKASYDAKDLVRTVPELVKFVNLKSRLIFQEMSENFTPKHWQALAKEVVKEIKKEKSKGIVILHGTDTLTYSACALSFMLRDLSIPVVFTFAQKSSDRGASDAFMNLLCSCIVAGYSDIAEVLIVGHGSIEDDFCYINRGNKTRKMHTSQRNTFRSINDFPIGKVFPNGKIEIMNKRYFKRDENREVYLEDKLEEKVALIKFYPGMNPKIIDWYIDKGYKGLVIEGTGLGHVNVSNSKFSLLPKIKRAIKEGVIVVMTSQCIYGRVNPYVYSNLRKLSEIGVLYLEDMLTECALVKLMWALGKGKDYDEVKKIMLSNIANEFNPRISPKTFLF